MFRKDCERHRLVTSRGLRESRESVNGCVNVFRKDCERHRSVTSPRLRESRESVNGDRRCIASFLLEFGEKLKGLKKQKGAECVCVCGCACGLVPFFREAFPCH